MNIFVLDLDPEKAAQAIDCVRVSKMVTESAQMMASALRRHGATDEQMPLTKAGRPYLGGYKNHPCTRWAGDRRENFDWLANHAIALCKEYTKRFGKTHACQKPIHTMSHTGYLFNGHCRKGMSTFAQAMPDEYKDEDAVKAYRAYYKSKVDSPGGVHYRHTNPPDWWEVTA